MTRWTIPSAWRIYAQPSPHLPLTPLPSSPPLQLTPLLSTPPTHTLLSIPATHTPPLLSTPPTHTPPLHTSHSHPPLNTCHSHPSPHLPPPPSSPHHPPPSLPHTPVSVLYRWRSGEIPVCPPEGVTRVSEHMKEVALLPLRAAPPLELACTAAAAGEGEVDACTTCTITLLPLCISPQLNR